MAYVDTSHRDGFSARGQWGAITGESRRVVRILVVESDPVLRQTVVDYLDDNNMRAVSASGREEMARHCVESEPDLVILDLRLGEEDGLDLLRELRAQSDVPIIATGHPPDEIDRVVGLELGADDYVTKPLRLRELLARIRSVLRRWERAPAESQPEQKKSRYRFGAWELNRITRRLVDRDGALVMLTKGEYALLVAFLDAPQRPLSREYLLQATRIHEDVFDRSVDVQVLRLRRKLEIEPNGPSIIRTERGFGYVFTLPVERL